MPGRRKCGSLGASAYYLVGRSWTHRIFDLSVLSGAAQGDIDEPLTTVTRPGCWINTIIAGGMVLSPEASAGCTCGFSVRASMAFSSKE